MPTISSVLVFENGMVAVCDERGQQMPEYQGEWARKHPAILRDKPDSVQVQHQSTVALPDGIYWYRWGTSKWEIVEVVTHRAFRNVVHLDEGSDDFLETLLRNGTFGPRINPPED